MIKLSRFTDYAVMLLATMAQADQEKMSAAVIAEKTRLGEASVAKILKILGQQGIIKSERGAAGGYRLAYAPDQLTMIRVIEAMEGPVALTACIDGSTDNCGLERLCSMNGRWSAVNEAIRMALADVTLAQMMQEPVLARHDKNHGKKDEMNQEARL